MGWAQRGLPLGHWAPLVRLLPSVLCLLAARPAVAAAAACTSSVLPGLLQERGASASLHTSGAQARARPPGPRRRFLLWSASAGLALLGLSRGGAAPAHAFVANPGSSLQAIRIIGRKKNVPKIVAGYRALKAAGAVEETWLQRDFPRMAGAMETWGSLQREGDLPDKLSRQLKRDVEVFREAAKRKDYDAAMKAFEVYMQDLPAIATGASGKIDISDPDAIPS
mmetsp:Transcript_106110/g.236776  ORF Transcript_106110/g.236776 Transcript_106110/m.236776 type:complete len:224 (+) Transcript_106110:58-729(+)